MSEGEDSGILGGNGPLEMNVVSLPKMDTVQLEQLGLNGPGSAIGVNSITTLGTSQHYVPTTPATQALLEGVVTQGTRTPLSSVAGSSTVTFTTAGSSSQDSYGSLEYVTQMPLPDDQQAKFQDALVSVDNVAFVEMNDAAIKSAAVSAPLELYFDVINPTTTAAVSASSVHHVRHEHQTPKAQLLERAYSDFLQQEHQQQQQQLPDQDQADHVLQDVTAANLVQLDHDGIPQPLHDYRKPPKLEHQKRQIHQIQQQQRQLQAQQLPRQQQHTDQHSQQRQVQLPLRLQQQQKPIQFQHPQQRQVQQQPLQQQQPQRLIQQQHQQKQFQEDVKKVDDQNCLNKSDIELQQQQTPPHIPLVSRSGRPIRRRQEYLEYVTQNMKEEELLVSHLPQQVVKVEEMVIGPDFEEEEPVEEVLEDEDPLEEDLDSNDEDDSGNYTIDGKKSLPHKKRIPKKLKTTKKHIKCYKCTFCEEQFTNQHQLNAHKQIHTSSYSKPKPFNCEICAKGYDNQLKFFEHLKYHYEPYKKHRCEVCGGEFENANALQEHSLVHSREHFKCDICNKTFRKESMLEVHLKVAHMQEEESNATEKPYTCVACSKSFCFQIALDTHIQTEHSENPPEFNCEDCYRGFKSKAKLQYHRKIEHKEGNQQNKVAAKKKVKVGKTAKGGFACTWCPRVFTHKNSLVYHIRGHTGERPHQCEQCGKAFYAASALKVHLRLHSGEKPYKCEDCGKFFRQWGDLRYHTTSVHSDARQFQCEFCGKDFKRKYCLVVHRRIHTGEKNYKCEHCGKAFRAASYLQNHRRIHTGVRPHPCPDCGKPFRARSDMKRHRQTHLRDGASSSVSQLSTQSSSPATHTQVEPQLIIADQVPVPGGNDQPIRIMVSGINAQQVTASVHPPPAHRQSQQVTSPVSGNITTLTAGPVSPGGTTTLTPEVIIMDDPTTSQPINLNIIPRMLAQDPVTSSPHASHIHVTADDEYLANPGRTALEVRGEDGNSVYVWHGVFTT